MNEQVTMIVSDPWEFPDENEGRLAFVATLVDIADDAWLLRFARAIVLEGQTWHFGVASPRYVGQTLHLKNCEMQPANIVFVTDARAENDFPALSHSRSLSTPGVIGSVEKGIASIIPAGGDSYTEPRWRPPHLRPNAKAQLGIERPVRIRSSPETERLGLVGKSGVVYGFTTPSVTRTPVIGHVFNDRAMEIYFEDTRERLYIAEHLLEYLDETQR